MRLDPMHHTIISTDVERSSDRTDALLLRMRRDLREMLADTLARQQIDIAKLTLIDDGDGFRVLLPAQFPPHAALDPFIGRLLIELRMHREASSAANRLRLRVAIHSGLLFGEEGGTYTGRPLKDCARLLDAPAGRALLSANPAADLVLLVSETFHDDVVRSGSSLDSATFQRVDITVKETSRQAWAYVPGAACDPAPSGAAPDPVPPGQPRPEPGRTPPSWPTPKRSFVAIEGDRNTFHGPIVGGDFHG